MTNEPQKIVVEVPSTSGNFTPVPHSSPESRIEIFRRGWQNAIALPDNWEDLIFDITSWVVVPALLTSCWTAFSIPNFLRVGALIAVGVGALVVWQMLAITEIKNHVIFRLILVTVGVIVGL